MSARATFTARHAGVMSRRVRSLRRAAGLSQTELAARAGVCLASVRRAEGGESLPWPPTMARILVALDSDRAWPVFLRPTPYRAAVAREARWLRERRAESHDPDELNITT